MPHYEYLCQACNKKFSLVLSVAEHDKDKIKCPKCGSTKVEQQWAAFFATTSKKKLEARPYSPRSFQSCFGSRPILSSVSTRTSTISARGSTNFDG